MWVIIGQITWLHANYRHLDHFWPFLGHSGPQIPNLGVPFLANFFSSKYRHVGCPERCHVMPGPLYGWTTIISNKCEWGHHQRNRDLLLVKVFDNGRKNRRFNLVDEWCWNALKSCVSTMSMMCTMGGMWQLNSGHCLQFWYGLPSDRPTIRQGPPHPNTTAVMMLILRLGHADE